MTELQLKAKIVKMIKEEYPDIFFWKVHDLFTAGVPDLVGCCKGVFFGIELKRPGHYPTRLQHYMLNQIKRAGGHAYVAHSAIQVKEILDKISQ